MIVGDIKDIFMHIGEEDALIVNNYIEEANKNREYGVWTELSEGLRGLTLNKSGFKENIFEYHQIYQDIHITLEGVDKIFLGNNVGKSSIQVYDEKNDYALFSSNKICEIEILPNSFVIINPFELHTNKIKNDNTIKVVIKRKPKNG